MQRWINKFPSYRTYSIKSNIVLIYRKYCNLLLEGVVNGIEFTRIDIFEYKSKLLNYYAYYYAGDKVFDDSRSTMSMLQALNCSAQVYCCEVLPRARWTRTDVELFHLSPNKCASVFNEQLHVVLGNRIRLIRWLLCEEPT